MLRTLLALALASAPAVAQTTPVYIQGHRRTAADVDRPLPGNRSGHYIGAALRVDFVQAVGHAPAVVVSLADGAVHLFLGQVETFELAGSTCLFLGIPKSALAGMQVARSDRIIEFPARDVGAPGESVITTSWTDHRGLVQTVETTKNAGETRERWLERHEKSVSDALKVFPRGKQSRLWRAASPAPLLAVRYHSGAAARAA